jgi:hypothetical protein
LTDIPERDDARNKEYDYDRSICIVPARTSVHAYVDDDGDLWIHTSDHAHGIDSELRIAADDVISFVGGLTELVKMRSIGRREQPKPKISNAERQRRFRAKRNAETVTRNAEGALQGVTPDDELPLNRGTA